MSLSREACLNSFYLRPRFYVMLCRKKSFGNIRLHTKPTLAVNTMLADHVQD